MLIGFAGYAQTGKDTCADYLFNKYGFQHHKFATSLKEMVANVDPYVFHYPNAYLRYSQAVRNHGYEGAKKRYPEVRNLLKNFGMEMRNQFGDDVWVDLLLDNIETFENNIVISDVRFINEAVAVKAYGGVVVRVNRPGVGPDSDHPSETEMDKIEYDYVIENDGSIVELELKIDHILQHI